MRVNRALLLLLCCVSLLSGCGLNPKGSGTGTTLRVANLVLGTTSLSVTAGPAGGTTPTTFLSGAAFEAINGYANVDSGNVEFKVSVASGTSNLLDQILSVSSTLHHTFVAYGTASGAAGLLLTDDVTIAGTGNFALRIVNGAPAVGGIDLYLTAPGASLAATSPTIANIGAGGASGFGIYTVGSYQIRITRTGTKEVIFDAAAPAFAQGVSQTLVAYSRGSGSLVNVAILGSDNSSSIANNTLAQFKVVNASSVASPLNVFLDGSLLLSNIPNAGVSSYQKAAAGVRKITVEATATPGATLVTNSPTLPAAQDTSIALTGSAGALSALVLPDTNIPITGGPAQVRFVNAVDGGPSLDVYVNFSKQIAGLAIRSASAYSSFDAATAGTTYEFDFNPAGTTAVALKLPGVTLSTGRIYTIYIVGPAAAPQGVVTQDY